jgi:serine O-acetyltransferase
MIVYRFGRWWYGVQPARKIFSLVYHVLFKMIQVATGIELPCEVELGHTLRLREWTGKRRD